MYIDELKKYHDFVLSIAIICVLILGPRIALADDPCQEPSKQVVAIIGALNKAVLSTPKPGNFAVKRLSAEHETGKFQVLYLVDGRSLFARNLEQQDTTSEHFGASASPSALELHYAFGAGGGVSCTYQITRTPKTFVAGFRGNGERRYRPFIK